MQQRKPRATHKINNNKNKVLCTVQYFKPTEKYEEVLVMNACSNSPLAMLINQHSGIFSNIVLCLFKLYINGSPTGSVFVLHISMLFLTYFSEVYIC